MNVNLLIDSIVRQTMVLIAQLATAAGVRAPLAHVANQVFLDLVTELKAQGLGHKVIADMFGLALRTYHSKLQRLSESTTDRGHSLWEAVLSYVRDNKLVIRADVLNRFCRDDEASVRGVLNDLVESGFLFRTGRGDRTSFRAATAEELEQGQAGDPQEQLDAMLWVIIHQQGTATRQSLASVVVVPELELEASLERLVQSGRVSIDEQDGRETYRCDHCVITYGDSVGWEAAVFDHYQAVSTAIANKVQRGASRALPDESIGGSTYHFDLYQGHPLEERVLGLLGTVRQQASALREDLNQHNSTQKDTGKRSVKGVADRNTDQKSYRVVFYAGQNLLIDELEEVKGESK